MRIRQVVTCDNCQQDFDMKEKDTVPNQYELPRQWISVTEQGVLGKKHLGFCRVHCLIGYFEP